MKRIWSILLLLALLVAPCTVLHSVQVLVGDLSLAAQTSDAGTRIDCAHQNNQKSQIDLCEFDCCDWRLVASWQAFEAHSGSVFRSIDTTGWTWPHAVGVYAEGNYAPGIYAILRLRNVPQQLVAFEKGDQYRSPLSLLQKTTRLRI